MPQPHEIIRTAGHYVDPLLARTIVIAILGTFVGLSVLVMFLSKARTNASRLARPRLSKASWRKLFEHAEQIVKTTLAELPSPIRAEAEKVTVLFQKWSPDKLGGFMYADESRISSSCGPIIIYVGSVQIHCESVGTDFQQEIRRTYLHELGHHLGLTESDLAQRGL